MIFHILYHFTSSGIVDLWNNLIKHWLQKLSASNSLTLSCSTQFRKTRRSLKMGFYRNGSPSFGHFLDNDHNAGQRRRGCKDPFWKFGILSYSCAWGVFLVPKSNPRMAWLVFDGWYTLVVAAHSKLDLMNSNLILVSHLVHLVGLTWS